jgi:hypothetical protein
VRVGADAAAAGVDHQRPGIEQPGDFLQPQRVRVARGQAPRRRLLQRAARFLHFGQQRRQAGPFGRRARAGQRGARGRDVQRTQAQFRRRQFGHGGQGRRQRAAVQPGQLRLRLVEPAQQQQLAHGDEPRLQGVGVVGVGFERGQRGGQRARRGAEVAHGQRHFRLGHDAAGPRQFLVRAEAPGGALEQFARARVLAEPGHGNAAQRQRRRVVAQGDMLEGAERVAGGKGARGGGDQGVHGESIHRRAARMERRLYGRVGA